jgi:NitT/TauT family transport system ATP-binding protein
MNQQAASLSTLTRPEPARDAAAPMRLEFRDVAKRFGSPRGRATITAVEDLSFALRDGEIVSIIGPSGCGKSTLLNMGSGLDPASSGEVFVDGERVTKPNAHVAFMLQKDLLLPWRTICENVEFGLEIQGRPRRDRRARAIDLLKKCRLADFVDHYPHQLSGGMRQRAALARTLAVDPAVLLMDEPFSALDAQTKMVLQQDLGRTLAETGKTALFVTHDLVEAITLSHRVLVMSQRPERIVKEFEVDIPDMGNPMARRKHLKVGAYIAELMELLHIEEAVA